MPMEPCLFTLEGVCVSCDGVYLLSYDVCLFTLEGLCLINGVFFTRVLEV